MPIAEKVIKAAAKLGDPEMVIVTALKKEIIGKIIEFSNIVRKFEKKYKTNLEDFEQQDLLNKLGHTWAVEEDYYEWDRAATELKELEEILKELG